MHIASRTEFALPTEVATAVSMTSPQISRQPPPRPMTCWLTDPCVFQKPGVRQMAGWHVPLSTNSQAPVLGLQESSVQSLLSLQVFSVCWQPCVGSQTSVVQALWSSQSSAPGLFWQPVAGTHTSFVQTLLSLHT